MREPQCVQHHQQRTRRHADTSEPRRDMTERGSGDRDQVDLGGGEYRRVVDAIADHRDDAALFVQGLHIRQLGLG